MNTNPAVDSYFSDGCGGCKLFQTPQCKVHTWTKELALLRDIILRCGLQEVLKWRHPCYTFGNANVLLLGSFKDYCGLMFIKGSLLRDQHAILVQQTENVTGGRQLRFTTPHDVLHLESVIIEYIHEAIEIEKAGVKVQYKKASEFEIPEELQHAFDENEMFATAFRALTPGRQKGYLLFFAQAKQSKTRVARIQKHWNDILTGKGLHD